MTSGMSQAPIVSVAPANLPFPFSLMAPIFARFPAIKAGFRDRDGTRCCARPSTASVCRCAESRIFSNGFIYRCGCDTLSRPGRASGICKIWMSICKALRSMCPGFSTSSGAGMSERQASRKADARPIGSASRISRHPRQTQAPIRADQQSWHYLGRNAASIVNYCRRYWSGQPLSSSPAESAANSLVNARMNKKRQLCWTPIGAHRVLQVGAAVADGRLKQAKLDLAA